MRTQVTFLHETNVPSNRLLSSVIIQWNVGSVGESAAGKQSTVLAWNPRRGRAARETAETFWHNTFTVSPGATVTAELEMTAQVWVWHLPLSVWHEENATKNVLFCFLVAFLQRRVRKIRRERSCAQEQWDPPFTTSQTDLDNKRGQCSWKSRLLALLLLLQPGFTPQSTSLKDELDPVTSSLFYLVSQTNYDVKVNWPQIVE